MTHCFSNRIHFSLAFPETPQSVASVWGTLSEFLKAEGCLPEYFEVQQLAGHLEQYKSEEYLRLAANDVVNLIAERNLNGFWVASGKSDRSVDFFLLHATGVGRQSVLGCRIGKKAKAPSDWSKPMERLMSLVPTIGGWQWRQVYQYWQGDRSGDRFYEMRWGPVPSGARRWHEPSIDGIGPGQERIDISLNPGRPKELLPIVNFLPAAEMWLGPHFWHYAKCTKDDALAADFFIEKRYTPHYLYLKCWPEPFTRPDGEQGRMQQRLWKLFFHEDCEWPPGSGTICDEPMYGPLELMPGYKPEST